MNSIDFSTAQRRHHFPATTGKRVALLGAARMNEVCVAPALFFRVRFRVVTGEGYLFIRTLGEGNYAIPLIAYFYWIYMS